MNLGDPIAIGNTAEIYLYENQIYKLFNDFLPETEALNEANKQKHAYACGLSVPKILDVTKVNDKQAIIMEYIKGETLGKMLFENQAKAEYYMNISIDIQLKIHMVVPDSLEMMNEKLSRQIEAANLLSKRHKTILLQKLNTMTFENRLCHGDYHLFNLIMLDKNVTIIDWVDSSAGDVRADVYRTYLLYSQVSKELADMYIRLYCEKSGLLIEEIFQWAPIIAGARLSETVQSENSARLINIVNQYHPL